MAEPVGCGVGGDDISGLTLTDLGSSSTGATASGTCFVGGTGDGASSGGCGAKRARASLGNFRRRILLALEALVVRFEDGGVETLARPLDARRVALLVFAAGGMSSVSYGLMTCVVRSGVWG